MALLECKNLSFSYEGDVVLRRVNFIVESGDFLCIVGENGSGKTTLMNGILGLKKQDSGQVIMGEGLVQKEIGYLPQRNDIQRDFPASVMEVVLSGRLNQMKRRLYYSAEDKRIARENLERLGILNLSESGFQNLSGGQQQRVLLARALCATKKLLLLDEPAASLDPIAQNELYNTIKLINLCDKITVIMVTHDIQNAARFASHILHLGNEQKYFGCIEDYRKSTYWKRITGAVNNDH